MKTGVVVMVVVLLAGLVAGCIQPLPVQLAQQEVETAQSELCANLEAYTASVTALQAVTADTTVATLEELIQAETDAYAKVVESWGGLQAAEVQTVESAVAEFQAALKGISAEDTLGDVATKVQTSATTVKGAIDQLDQQACVAPK